jgi:predicted methyltransferase
VVVTQLQPPIAVESAPAGTADMVLTFRNIHNWMESGSAQAVLEEAFSSLKSGGIFGVVEHRAKPGTSLEMMIESGYVTQAKVVELVQAAGFELVASSEVNANPKDSASHPEGVWTLPPNLRLGEERRDHYLAIGESDRMTLKFRKP